MVIGWYSDAFQRLQQFPAVRQKLPGTALPSLALKDTIYGLVLWNPHRQGLLTAEVPSEKEGMETVTRASPETETTPPSHS